MLESGEIKTTRKQPQDSSATKKSKTGALQVSASKAEIEPVFAIARSLEVSGEKHSYLAKPGTFDYYGHTVITVLKLTDANKSLIQEITFSSKPEHPVPATITDLATKCAELLNKKFGPPPPMLLN